MGERRLCKPEVTGSSPVFSTKWIDQKWMVSYEAAEFSHRADHALLVDPPP